MKSALRNSFIKISLSVFLCLAFSSAWSRSIFPFNKETTGGDMHIGLIVRNDFLPNNNTVKTYGLRIQYPLNKHWYLDYDYHFIAAGSGIHLSHLPVCAMGVKYLLNFAPAGSDWAYTAMLLMVIPEGASYKINPGKKIQYIPYLNPLGLDRLVFEREGQVVKKPWGFSCNTGLEIQSDLPSRFYAAADAGITYNYASGKTAFGAGISLGMKW